MAATKTQVLTRKLQLYPYVSDKETKEEKDEEIKRAYQYVRDGMFNQAKAMNVLMTQHYLSTMMEFKPDERREVINMYSRIAGSKKGSGIEGFDIKLAKGLGYTAMAQRVKQDFDADVKNGLLYGKRALRTYNKDCPLYIPKPNIAHSKEDAKKICLYHTYENHNEFLKGVGSDVASYDKDEGKVTGKYTYKCECGNIINVDTKRDKSDMWF